jgi:hypothetical protein
MTLDHVLPHSAQGTGGHDHHRAVLERDGLRVGWWRCDRAAPGTQHCPDDPDPHDLMERKVAEGAARRATMTLPSRDRCRYGHGAEHQTRNSQGSAICIACRRQASARARMKRIADRIVGVA